MRLTERASGLRSQYGYDAGGRLTRLWHTAKQRTFADFTYTLDARGNRTRALELLTNAGTGSTTLNKDHQAVTYLRGNWADSGSFKVSGNISAAMRVIFSGDQLTLTVGVGPDHSLYDVYIDSSYWDTLDGYAASASELALPTQVSGDGVHTLEIRNRADRHALSTGYVVRFKQLQTNRAYRLHMWAYDYDGLARVRNANQYPNDNLMATPERAEAYSFDVAGNRTSESVTINGGTPTVTTWSYNAANQISTTGFTFDPNGNLTNDGSNAYTWDRANRLLSMGGTSYAYEGMGNRIKQTVGATVTQYLLDVQPGLAVVLSQTTGANTDRYVHAPHGIHAQKDAAGNWEWMLHDGLGSVRGVMDNANAVLWSGSYDPFGTGIGASGTIQTSYGFTGEQYDSTNDLLYLRARYYTPGLGIFTALDPFKGMSQRPMSLNGYAWVEGNTPNGLDPSGKIYELPNQFANCIGGVKLPAPILRRQLVSPMNCPNDLAERTCFEYFAGDLDFAAQYPNEPTSQQIELDYAQCIASCGMSINRPQSEPELLWLVYNFEPSEYPLSCSGFSSAENCLLYHLDFLSTTQTIRDLSSRNGQFSVDDYYRFAGFVAPDSLWRSLTGNPNGTPADIKDFYRIFETQSTGGLCISMFGQEYGRDVPGNIAFGYIGTRAGFSPLALKASAGFAQIADDFRTGSSTSSVNFGADFGDSPEDQVAIDAGIVLYRSCGTGCTASDIRTVLTVMRMEYVQATGASNRAQCRPSK